MGRSDHSDGQVEFADFFEFLCQNGGKGVEDVGEVFHGFAVQETLVGFVVEQFFYGIVLAEGIHREEDVVAGHVRCHGIRPMEHTHFYENKLFAIADVEAVAGFDDVEIPAPFAVLAFNAADSVGRAINRRIRNFFHERRQGAGMVAFTVVGNVEKLADRVTLPRASRNDAIRRYALDFAERLQREVIHSPLEWFNFYDFWQGAGRDFSRGKN